MPKNVVKEQLRADFGNYLRQNLQAPSDWNAELYGSFPATMQMFLNYFTDILERGENRVKIKALEDHYELVNCKSIKERKTKINGGPRKIQNFFKDTEIVSYESSLNFMAVVFESPIKSLAEFAQFQKQTTQLNSIAEIADNTKKTEEKELLESPPNQPKPKRAYIYAAIGLCVFIFAIASVTHLLKANSHEVDTLGQRLLQNTFKVKNIGDSAFCGVFPIPADMNKDTVQLDYLTINIFNDLCIYSTKGFPFATDSAGEDIYSRYGGDYRDMIRPTFPMPANTVTIANQTMDIYFGITDKTGSGKYYTANLLISITEEYPIKENSPYKYNVYQERELSDKGLPVVFDGKKNYAFATDKKQLPANLMQGFSVHIKGNENCENQIYKFKIVVDVVDLQGNHRKIESDKEYIIAFKPLR